MAEKRYPCGASKLRNLTASWSKSAKKNSGYVLALSLNAFAFAEMVAHFLRTWIAP